MKKLLITGGNGFLGSRIIKALNDKYEIFSATSDKLDITDEKRVLNIVKEVRPDFIIHGAAVAETKFCEENPEFAYNLNVNGAVNMAKAADAVKSKMIFFSTEQIFNGNSGEGPFKEEDLAMANTQYGKTKLEAEKKILDTVEGLWILRLTWMFGMPERGLKINPNILWDTVKSAYKQQKAIVPVNEYRGMTYVYDLVDQIEKVFGMDRGIYHTGSENNMSRYHTVKFILKELGLTEDGIDKMLIPDKEKYADKNRDVRLDTLKIKKSGLAFDNTQEALAKAIREYSMC